MTDDRETLVVASHDGVWSVEHSGERFGHSRDKEVTKAAANKRAREMHDKGLRCQVRISGEHGFFA